MGKNKEAAVITELREIRLLEEAAASARLCVRRSGAEFGIGE